MRRKPGLPAFSLPVYDFPRVPVYHSYRVSLILPRTINLMKTSYPPTLRLIMLLIWVIFTLILTTQSDRIPLVHLMTSTIGSTDLGDSIGHAGLFGMLACLSYLALSRLLPMRHALLLAITLALATGTSTELFQLFVTDRATSLSDMLANWLGVFVVGFAVAFRSLSCSPAKNTEQS